MPKFKMGEDQKPLYQDGKFVLVLDDGAETTFDALGAYSTFGTIRDERDKAKGRADAAEAALKTFGATDEDRKKLLEKAKLADSIDAKKLIDAGKVEELVADRLKDATKAWQEKESALTAKVAEKEAAVRRHLISGRFSSSKALEGTVLTPDLAEAKFGHLFDVDGDEPVAYRDAKKAEKLYSRSEPAKVAGFDEALSILISSDPNYGSWKKGTGSTGSGAPGSGGNAGNAKLMERGQFFALPPAEQMAFTKSGGKVADAAA